MSTSGPLLRASPTRTTQRSGIEEPYSAAAVERIGVRLRDIGLGQIVIIDGGPQLAVEELEFEAGFGVARAARRSDDPGIDDARIGRKTLGVADIAAHPGKGTPQQAETRRQMLLRARLLRHGLRRRPIRGEAWDAGQPAALAEILIAGARQEEEIIRKLDLILRVEAGSVLRSRKRLRGRTGSRNGIPG